MGNEDAVIEYCRCEKSSSVYAKTDDFGYWLCCNDCNKVIGIAMNTSTTMMVRIIQATRTKFLI